jgi:tripartite-type tricarboxylate transporter receptor subunit TctC
MTSLRLLASALTAIVPALVFVCGACFAPAAWSQTINKTARIVVGFPPGGTADIVARLVADKLRGVYAPSVIVENRPGGAGRTAAEHVKSAEADGSVVLLTPRSMLTVFPHLYQSLGYDALRDFLPVTSAGNFPFAITAGPAAPDTVRTLPDFIKWAKANPKGGAFASPGAGTSAHFVGLVLSRSSGVSLTHVPYKGAQPAVQDLLGGQVPVAVLPQGDVLPHVRAGKLRVLATTGSQRSPFFKDAPTAKEAGFRQIEAEEGFVIVVPAKVPPLVADRLGTLIRAGQQSADVLERFGQLGLDARPSSAAETARLLKADYDRWGPIVKASGFRAED